MEYSPGQEIFKSEPYAHVVKVHVRNYQSMPNIEPRHKVYGSPEFNSLIHFRSVSQFVISVSAPKLTAMVHHPLKLALHVQ